EGETVRHLHIVSVLSGNRPAAKRGQRRSDDRQQPGWNSHRAHSPMGKPYGSAGFGFQACTSFSASAIWAAVILDATRSRWLAACSRSSFVEAGDRDAARLTQR